MQIYEVNVTQPATQTSKCSFQHTAYFGHRTPNVKRLSKNIFNSDFWGCLCGASCSLFVAILQSVLHARTRRVRMRGKHLAKRLRGKKMDVE